jgi:uncharacterized protein
MGRLLSVFVVLFLAGLGFAAPGKLKVLYLGDRGHHLPKQRFDQLEPVLTKRGIELVYTESLDDITLKNLNNYDGLMIFANQDRGKPEHVKAIMDYVASGKGFIPLHCASFCFTNDADYINLVGAQFRSHTTGVFRTKQTKAEHPILKNFDSFESWDETYVHHKHNTKDRTVLEVRKDNDIEEPWTWVRTHGKGRVFYTAWGHDHRTWSHEGFHALVERGTRWACGQDIAELPAYVDAPKMTKPTGDIKEFEYVEAKVPNYPPSKQWGVQAKPNDKMQKPLTPEKSVKHYSTPEGFELKLFAADDQFAGGKPMAMTWDEQGRLWAVVTTDYPNEMQKPGEGRDKIVVLEDTDGDGKADKTIVFADKLSIPTSLLCVHGGVMVHQAPVTLFLKDTDGDGKADVRKEILTGWNTSDTHAGPSNLRYGFDNWIYGSVGYAGYQGTVGGERFNFRQGYYRFKLEVKDGLPVATKMEFLRSTNNNTWGFTFNEDGEMFGSTANGCVLVHLPIPNRYYEKVKGMSASVLAPIALDNKFHPITEQVRQVDWHGGFTAASHCAVYTARTYPEEYWNRTAFVSEPTGHLTATFVLQPNGTDYVARYGWNLVAGQDEWISPIDAQVGPDGHVWILDWYNFIVQHNPTPQGFKTGKGAAYETELRDKKHGRVYRLVYTKAKEAKTPNLAKADNTTLVNTLKHDNLFWRLTAQRLLLERGDVKSITGLKEQNSLHSKLILAILGEAEAKTAAPSVTGTSRERLKALLALADKDSGTGSALWSALQDEKNYGDKNLTDALTIATSVGLVEVVQEAKSNPRVLKAQSLSIVQRAAQGYAARGDAKTIGKLIEAVAEQKEATFKSSVVFGIAAGWPANKTVTLNEAEQKAFATLLTSTEGPNRGSLLKLAGTWGVKGLEKQLAEVAKGLLTTVQDAKATELVRLDAAKQAIELAPTDDTTAQAIVQLVNAKGSTTFNAGLLEALSNSKSKNLGNDLVAKLGDMPVSLRSQALRLILARPESTGAYLDAVEKGTLRFDMLALDQKTALAAHPNAKIAERAKKLLAAGGGLPDTNRQKVIDDYHEVLKADGNVANGKKLFTQHCAKCHKHGGEGAQIGPDLTGFAVHPKEEILIHVLDPSRSVEGNYRAYSVNQLDGSTLTGLLSSETKTTVEILDAENKRHTIQRDEIDVMKESPKSLMPEGFEKDLTKPLMADLLTFLTQRGKYLPIPLDKAATVITTRGMFFKENGEIERLVFKDWMPKEFNGVPFVLVDPQGDKLKNAIMLFGKNGDTPPTMPKTVTLPCNSTAKSIHFLSGVGGWNFPSTPKGSLTMTVRLVYADGKTEDHEWKNGVHFADYIRKIDVPESKHAFSLRGQQIRYLSVSPARKESIKQIELIKGTDDSAPVVMAVTIEGE